MARLHMIPTKLIHNHRAGEITLFSSWYFRHVQSNIGASTATQTTAYTTYANHDKLNRINGLYIFVWNVRRKDNQHESWIYRQKEKSILSFMLPCNYQRRCRWTSKHNGDRTRRHKHCNPDNVPHVMVGNIDTYRNTDTIVVWMLDHRDWWVTSF